MAFNNAGTVNVLGGELDLWSGGSQSGPFGGNPGTTLSFGGNHTFTAAATIDGGNVIIIGGTSSDAASSTPAGA